MFIKITGIIISMFILTNEVNAKPTPLKFRSIEGLLPITERGNPKHDPFPTYIDLSEYHPDGSHEWDIDNIAPSKPNGSIVKRPHL